MILRQGDVVALVAPAAQLRGADGHLLQEGLQLLEGWGLKVEPMLTPGHHFYLAGSDSVRAQHLVRALEREDVAAIFCLRGGYGGPRLLRHLVASPQPRRKLLVGYSDVTALHLAAGRLWPAVLPVHAPNIATSQLLGPEPASAQNRKDLHGVLFDPGYSVEAQLEFLCPGDAAGPLLGGCLSMVVGSLGTPFRPSFEKSILFLEDTGEAPFRVDRMVTHLRNAGALDGVRGVVFGEMRNCVDPYNDLRTVLQDLLGDLGVPIAFGLCSGHGSRNRPLRLGAVAELKSDSGRFRQTPLSS